MFEPVIAEEDAVLAGEVDDGEVAAFAVLAGISISLIVGRHRLTPGAVATGKAASLATRALVIGVIGLLLGFTDPELGVVILPYYAVMFVLAVPLTNSEGSFVVQLIGVASIFAWVFVCSLIVWGVIKLVMGLRVTEEEEYEGVDIAECGMEAYPEFTRK